MVTNKKISHDYYIIKMYECGIKLESWEVKSLYENSVNISNSFARILNGKEVILFQCHISAYKNCKNEVDTDRDKKLLLNKKEINSIKELVKCGGFNLIPKEIYRAKNGKFKLTLCLCKGKKNYDKRDSEKKKADEKTIKDFSYGKV